MTQSPSSGGNAQVTEEQVQMVKQGVTQLVKNFEQDAVGVKKDKTGFFTLGKACEYLFGKDASVNNKSDTGFSQLWETFKKAAREIAKFASKFLRDLKKAPISLETKKEIARICRQFKTLLQNTSQKLQAYRLDVYKMVKIFDYIIELLIPPEDEVEDLEELTKRERLKIIKEFATENKNELSSKLTELSNQMKNNKNKDALKILVDKWGMLQVSFNKVIALVKSDQEEFRSRMKKFVAFSCIAGALLCGVLCLTGAGAVGAFLGGGIKLGKVIVGVAAVTCIGLTAISALLFFVPEFADILNVGKNKAIDSIADGLRKIGEQSDVMETMLHKLYKQWIETMSDDPKASYSEWRGKVQAKGILKKLNETKTGLEQLITSIEETEKVCEDQLSQYTQKIYIPLLNLHFN